MQLKKKVRKKQAVIASILLEIAALSPKALELLFPNDGRRHGMDTKLVDSEQNVEPAAKLISVIRVDVTLTTHDCGGISGKDVRMAKFMEAACEVDLDGEEQKEG